ncbi:Mu-like prophage major head subunit gpT family protein [Oceanospirillum beijerinckii]|uniref:Mu-like prophage major head subunit gpT family protein n=1 Tax=Oceanospirillum beijerinckii TaxID=64976 RepID=UPI00041F33B6|nr:Mu-like prophage major head subunit gpT family protein [Oceanospirillum beijerinckii]
MDISKEALQSLYAAVNTSFNKGRDSYQPLWHKVATQVPSSGSEENYSWLGEFSRLREWIGDRQINRMKVSNYVVRNRKFEATESIPAERIEDDTYGIMAPKFEDMGYAAATHPDELVFSLLKDGFSTPCYDGLNFFDDSHMVGSDGEQKAVSNLIQGSSAPWFLLDTKRPLKPLILQTRRDYRLQAKTDAGTSDHVFLSDEYLYGVDARLNAGFGFWQQAIGATSDLTEDNFNQAYSMITEMKSDKGRPLGLVPSLLVVGPSNRIQAKQLVEAERKAYGESNANYGAVEVLVVPWLD